MSQRVEQRDAGQPVDPHFDPLDPGYLADYAKRKGWGRKTSLVSFTLIQGLLTLAFGFYIMQGGQSVLVLGALLLTASLFFNALQPMSHALTAVLVPSAAYLGAAFGLWNLIGEMGPSSLQPSAGRCGTRRGPGLQP